MSPAANRIHADMRNRGAVETASPAVIAMVGSPSVSGCQVGKPSRSAALAETLAGATFRVLAQKSAYASIFHNQFDQRL